MQWQNRYKIIIFKSSNPNFLLYYFYFCLNYQKNWMMIILNIILNWPYYADIKFIWSQWSHGVFLIYFTQNLYENNRTNLTECHTRLYVKLKWSSFHLSFTRITVDKVCVMIQNSPFRFPVCFPISFLATLILLNKLLSISLADIANIR